MSAAAKALIVDESGKILVLYRSETHPTLAHDIDLPGGVIESHESMELGLAREICEETGLVVDTNAFDLRHSWLTQSGQEQAVYQVTINSADQVKISWEHEAHDWISVEEMIDYPAIDGFIHQVQAWLRA